MSELLYTPFAYIQIYFKCGCSPLRVYWRPEPMQPRDIGIPEKCPQCAARAQRLAAAKKAKRGEVLAV